ncbi:hypothetical protein ACHQM5_025013 [Ranunculus cassubicifolius]
MTSASELFHSSSSSSRRSRLGLRNNDHYSDNLISFDRSSPIPIPNHHHHSRRRHRHHHRRDIEDCDSPLRRPTRHREHESVQLDHAASQFNPGNTSNNGTSSSTRANGMQFSRSDQLPGDVLLARERLVERLRGVSLSSNRQTVRSFSGIPWDELTYNDEFRLVDAGDWEIETSADRVARETPFSNSSDVSKKRPQGLNLEELKHLHHEIFIIENKDNPLECSICLNRLHKGDELVCLPCEHKFHKTCLYPWVNICGDCPNCRASVLVGNNVKTGKEVVVSP